MKRFIYIVSVCILTFSCVSKTDDIIVEAEFFDTCGGWLLDQQFYEQVGSAYLIAHGVGTPVTDASTTVCVDRNRKYHVWARTFNWNSPWDSLQAPGLFRVAINGQELENTLGDKYSDWNWQYAGQFTAPRSRVTLSLKDLTGFDGRCDAIFLTTSDLPVFPEERDLPLVDCDEEYDFIVVGAGTAGLSAAISASRLGLKTLILDDKPSVGGNSGPDIHVVVSGRIHEGPYPKLGNITSEYGCAYRNYTEFEKKLAGEYGLTVRTLNRVVEVEKQGDRISSVIAVDFSTKRKVRYKAPMFADCTGDANLGVLAGAEWMMGPETRDVYGESLAPETAGHFSFGSTVRWYSVENDSTSIFPHTPWAVSFNDATCRDLVKGKWNWESGYTMNQIEDAETIRDFMFRVIYGNWSHQKNSPKFKSKYDRMALTPESVSIFLGKRESRRLIGDYIITERDCYGEWKRHDDAAVWCTYPIDQHFPTEEMNRIFPGEEFESAMKHNHMPLGTPRKFLVEGRDYNYPFMIPYRCFYSANISNMFMAGRNISGSRIAMCAYRVMATTAMMGEVVGIAASICHRQKCMPREVYTDYLDTLKNSLIDGVPSKYEHVYIPK